MAIPTKDFKMGSFIKIFILGIALLSSQILTAQVAISDEEKKAFLHDLAAGGDPASLPVLAKAAKTVGYQHEPTDAITSLLLYASVASKNGDVNTTVTATTLVIKNCVTTETNDFRITAMTILAETDKDKALPVLLNAVNDKDIKVREAVIRLANTIPGPEATKKWIARYSKVSPQGKADVLFLLGERNDNLALPLVKKAMDEKSLDVSSEAIAALAKLVKSEAVEPILKWLLRINSEEGDTKAADVLVTILNQDNIGKVAACLKPSSGHATVILIQLLSWSRDPRFFDSVMPYIFSDDIAVYATALTSLKNLASEKDQDVLIKVLAASEERPVIVSLQDALALAANKVQDPERRSDKIIEAIKSGVPARNLIPVLAQTGGQNALDFVVSEFEKGNPETQEVCFDAMQGWKDYTATSALYSVCASGNNIYGKAALDSYIRLASIASVPYDVKLGLFQKIAPYALYPDSRSEMVVQTGFIKTKQAFTFVSQYLNDNDNAVVYYAAQALENIALPLSDGTGGLYDEEVRQALEKVLSILTGEENKELREKVVNYLNEMEGR